MNCNNLIEIRRKIFLKSGIKTLAVWLILGVIFIVLLSSVIDNADNKMIYSELIEKNRFRRGKIYRSISRWHKGNCRA